MIPLVLALVGFGVAGLGVGLDLTSTAGLGVSIPFVLLGALLLAFAGAATTDPSGASQSLLSAAPTERRFADGLTLATWILGFFAVMTILGTASLVAADVAGGTPPGARFSPIPFVAAWAICYALLLRRRRRAARHGE